MVNYEKEIKKISKWMRQYSEKTQTNGFVIGLSGGIDSAIVSSLAVQAVGKEKVLGVNMPCVSSPDMATDAKELAANLNINFKVIDLFDSYKEIIDRLKEAYNKEIKNITQANIKARLRMTTLYAIANQNNMLVAGTGNLSELSVGYFTKFGDGGVDCEPIGNYYKTEVYEMAKLIKKIPIPILTKKPSADLWSGQTDEEEIGMSYKELDEILKKINNNESMIWKQGDKIHKIIRLVNSSKHKNNLPPRYERE